MFTLYLFDRCLIGIRFLRSLWQSLKQVKIQQALPVTSSRIGQAVPDLSLKATKKEVEAL